MALTVSVIICNNLSNQAIFVYKAVYAPAHLVPYFFKLAKYNIRQANVLRSTKHYQEANFCRFDEIH